MQDAASHFHSASVFLDDLVLGIVSDAAKLMSKAESTDDIQRASAAAAIAYHRRHGLVFFGRFGRLVDHTGHRLASDIFFF